jgi:hypothetical protein
MLKDELGPQHDNQLGKAENPQERDGGKLVNLLIG